MLKSATPSRYELEPRRRSKSNMDKKERDAVEASTKTAALSRYELVKSRHSKFNTKERKK